MSLRLRLRAGPRFIRLLKIPHGVEACLNYSLSSIFIIIPLRYALVQRHLICRIQSSYPGLPLEQGARKRQ